MRGGIAGDLGPGVIFLTAPQVRRARRPTRDCAAFSLVPKCTEGQFQSAGPVGAHPK